jgi:RNA polymerase sigma-70 factor (ECF subfamily)
MTGTKPHIDLEEREQILLAGEGDLGAFEVLYNRYRDRVYNLVRYSIDDAVAAEDVLQSIFLKIYRSLRYFRFESALSTWIYRITVNECLNHVQRGRVNVVPLEAILGSGDEIDLAPAADSRHLANERDEVIRQAVMELSPKLRTVVALKYVEGLSYEEIASILDCAPGTVASRLNRALVRLEARLRPLRRLL